MLERLIRYFSEKHLLINLITALVLIGGVFAWFQTSKEELPDITFDFVRISVNYPGASASDVEYLVTKPLEEAVRGLDGVYRVESTSSIGASNITVELEQNYPKVDEAVTEIRNAVMDEDLPAEILDDPNVRVFKTSKKAILDIALIHKDARILTPESRRELQQYALALENQLLALSEVNSVNRDGYLQEEIQIKAEPDKLRQFAIPFNTAMSEISKNHVRKPAGTIEAPEEPKVTLISELDTPEKLGELIIQGGFEGQVIRLGQVAQIAEGYEKTQTVRKINGHEGIMFSVVKNSSYGILETLDAVNRAVRAFRENNLAGTPIELILLDDESIDIRNRLSLIAINGSIGFILILIMLFVFLDKRSAIWVALGIPFSIAATMIFGSWLGYTVNGTTLAALIIVLGIVVDDAIVVAENITRQIHARVPAKDAVVHGTRFVALPILASIVTTCIAFVPLFFFTGRFGRFIEHIPPIIFLMLGASLFESIFILPGHMNMPLTFLNRFRVKGIPVKEDAIGHWFHRVEERYGSWLEKILSYKKQIFAGFGGLLIFSLVIGSTQMKFVMFPNEETRDIVLIGEAPDGTKRYETAAMTQKIEDTFIPYLGKEVVGYRNTIASSRRGGAVEENKFRMIIEIVPREKRRKSADQLIKELQKEIDKIQGFKKITFQKSRWGQESGSPIEILVQVSRDSTRQELIEELAGILKEHKALKNIEIDQGLRVPEYKVDIDRDKVKRLAIDPNDIASTFRAALEGTVLYEFFNGDEDVHVRFSILESAKSDIKKVLALPVENQGNYLVPLGDVVKVEEVVSPNSISRRNLKRTARIYADIEKSARKTPVEIAEDLERNVFPKLLKKYPSAVLSFTGEVEDTRESKADLINAVILALILIYIVLAVLLNSTVKPLMIMLAIPFGMIGVVLAFWLHGKVLFGFYAAIGALGLAGVVINDSIVMLVKLDHEFEGKKGQKVTHGEIARVSQTRLRAVLLTTLTTVAGVLPTAYGLAGYDAMLAEMMLALCWGLLFGTAITLVLVPCLYSFLKETELKLNPGSASL